MSIDYSRLFPHYFLRVLFRTPFVPPSAPQTSQRPTTHSCTLL